MHSGGSGCACCATVFSGYVFNMLKQKKYKKVLLIATGALTNSCCNVGLLKSNDQLTTGPTGCSLPK